MCAAAVELDCPIYELGMIRKITKIKDQEIISLDLVEIIYNKLLKYINTPQTSLFNKSKLF